MTRFVIDAPTLVHVVSEGIAIHPDHQLVAPSSLRSQALGLLLTQVRAGDLTEKEARALFDPITETKVRVLGDRMSRRTAWDIARERDWATLQHAEYLAGRAVRALTRSGQATSNRSLSMTLTQARTKSRTNFSPASALA